MMSLTGVEFFTLCFVFSSCVLEITNDSSKVNTRAHARALKRFGTWILSFTLGNFMCEIFEFSTFDTVTIGIALLAAVYLRLLVYLVCITKPWRADLIYDFNTGLGTETILLRADQVLLLVSRRIPSLTCTSTR